MIMGNSTGLSQTGATSLMESYGDNDIRGNAVNTSGTITPIGATRE